MATVQPDTTGGRVFTRVHHAQASAYPEPAELAVASDTAWQAAWAALFPNLPAGKPVPPAVDFGAEVVLLVAAGPRSTGGHDVRIDAVESDAGGGLVVRYTVTAPGPGCMTAQVMTSPVDVVRAARPSGPVRFVARRAMTAC
ncbi:MAG TPA: protease complex subunit PrcB family protein [Gemmatirosa sp.]